MRKFNGLSKKGEALVEVGIAMLSAGKDKTKFLEDGTVVKLLDKESFVIKTSYHKIVVQKGVTKSDMFRKVTPYSYIVYKLGKKKMTSVYKDVYEKIEMLVKMTLIKNKH